MLDIRGHFIGGEWDGDSGTFDVVNPSNQAVFSQAPDGTRESATKAIEAAYAAFPAWANLAFTERADYLEKFRSTLLAKGPQIAGALAAETGAAMGIAMFQVKKTPEVVRAAIAASYAPEGEIMPSGGGKMNLAIRRPIGVVTVITPWNAPLILTARGIFFALAAGNTVVLKPSEESPYCGGLVFAEIAEEIGLPKGVLNVVTSSRENVVEVGDELIENPLVKGISFTGSSAVGTNIAEKAAELLKKCCVELGGKDALIVCDDADIDLAARAANFGSNIHAGQICMAVERVLVQASVFDDFMEKFTTRVGDLKVGDVSADKSLPVGPLINQKQASKVKEQLDDAVAKGAKIEVGGGVEGLFVQPTVVTGVTSDMKIWSEETFGPVAIVIPFETDEQAIELSNGSNYGLSSGVMTGDEARGLAIAYRLETGMCHINDQTVNDEPHCPFGGSKNSGIGRHGGRWAMDTFTETRWISMQRGEKQFPPMF